VPGPVSRLRVAAAQAESVPGEVAANVATAVSLVCSAADRGARVVVLPELFLTGYDPAVWTHGNALPVDRSTGGRASAPDDPRLQPLAAATAERSVAAVVGAAVRLEPQTGTARAAAATTLSAVLFDASGGVRVAYDKQHLCGPERDFFTAGTGGSTLMVDGWDLGLGICYDGCFPEHATAAAADGALAYLCPAAYYAGAEHRMNLRYAARALDNGIYVVLAGLTGTCGDGAFTGGSAIYDPEGRTLARVGRDAPAVVVADLDASEVRRAQDANPVALERLPDLGPRARVVAP
jgi:5-aminopentanamidase